MPSRSPLLSSLALWAITLGLGGCDRGSESGSETPPERGATAPDDPAPTAESSDPPGAAPSKTAIGGVKVGSAAPDFELEASDGARASLASLRASGPVVVVFYRGDWCPICRKQLGELQANLDAFQAKGASVVAVSVDPPATSAALVEKLELSFPVLSDTDLATIRAYEVEHVGEDIARPSTYVIDGDGQVVWAWVGENARDRPPLDQILLAVPQSAQP